MYIWKRGILIDIVQKANKLRSKINGKEIVIQEFGVGMEKHNLGRGNRT